MIKKTIYIENSTYLKTHLNQLILEIVETGEQKSISIEDIGVIILDNPRITISQSVLTKFLENNTAVITCNDLHHPVGMFWVLDGNTLQSQKFKVQIDASIPLKKSLWQQTIIAKINNQAALFESEKLNNKYLLKLSGNVKSGDSENCEAQAASYYWKNIFPEFLDFKRERYGPPPNNLLNYGYAILRALVAKSLTGSGLLPTLGIHHRNQYNAYCLADDIMEPYRPYVDKVVLNIIKWNGKYLEMTPKMKKELLLIPQMDVIIDGKKSPLMNAIQRTTASLAKCYEGKLRKVIYPNMLIT